MSTSTLSLLRLPCLLTEDILKNLDVFELFSLSTLSARSERVVKAYSSRRQFEFWNEIDENYVLKLRESPFSQALEIEFRASNNSGTVFKPAKNAVQVYCEDISEEMPRMLEHLSTMFKATFIDLGFNVKDEKIKNRINDVVKKHNITVEEYNDSKNEYSYQEVENLLGSEWLHLKYTKLTDIQLRRILKKCIDRPRATSMCLQNVGAPDLFQKIASMVEGEKRMSTTSYGSTLRMRQDDGRFISVTVVNELVKIRVDAKK